VIGRLQMGTSAGIALNCGSGGDAASRRGVVGSNDDA
jgi:hypothetical protein